VPLSFLYRDFHVSSSFLPPPQPQGLFGFFHSFPLWLVELTMYSEKPYPAVGLAPGPLLLFFSLPFLGDSALVYVRVCTSFFITTTFSPGSLHCCFPAFAFFSAVSFTYFKLRVFHRLGFLFRLSLFPFPPKLDGSHILVIAVVFFYMITHLRILFSILRNPNLLTPLVFSASLFALLWLSSLLGNLIRNICTCRCSKIFLLSPPLFASSWFFRSLRGLSVLSP